VHLDASPESSERDIEAIVISDIHANLDAQTHIAAFLTQLAKIEPHLKILVEGARGRVDTSLLAYFPDSLIRGKIADRLLTEHRLSGVEYFSATETRSANI